MELRLSRSAYLNGSGGLTLSHKGRGCIPFAAQFGSPLIEAYSPVSQVTVLSAQVG